MGGEERKSTWRWLMCLHGTGVFQSFCFIIGGRHDLGFLFEQYIGGRISLPRSFLHFAPEKSTSEITFSILKLVA